MRFSIGHPAYIGRNRFADNLNAECAFAELLSRRVAPSVAERMIQQASAGSFTAGETIDGHVVEMCQFERQHTYNERRAAGGRV